MDKIFFEIRKFLYKKRRDLNFMFVCACFLILVILITIMHFAAYKPLKDKYTNDLNSSYTYLANINRLPELVTSSEAMNEKINDISDAYKKLGDIVPDKRNIPYITSQISLAAQNNHVTIGKMDKVLDTTITIGKQDFGVVQYQLTCYSSYEDAANFLVAMETSKGIFAIDKIKINPLSEDELKKYNDASLVKTILNINIYMKAK